jgi:hypothetical protein
MLHHGNFKGRNPYHEVDIFAWGFTLTPYIKFICKVSIYSLSLSPPLSVVFAKEGIFY